jgi:hypothetical protein
VAFPEPIPVIRGKRDVEEFYRRLRSFKLTEEQKELYRDAMERYQRRDARELGSPNH